MIRFYHKPLICLAACLLLANTGCVQHKTYVGSDKPVVDKQVNQIEAAQTRISLGLAYLQKGNAAQAKYNLEKALEFAPDLAQANYSLAYYYQTVNNLDKAQYYYEKVIALDEQNGDALNNYGAFLCDQGNIEKAKKLFLQAVELDSYIRVAQTYENLGLCLLNTDKPEYREQAKSYFITALGYDRKMTKSIASLTQIEIDRQNWDKAWQYFKMLEQLNKQSPVYLWLAYQLYQQKGMASQAKQYQTKLMTKFPNSPQAKFYKESVLK
ncbi:type IV pilus biogenesis/stability protein PilW [Catenovulum adriaticum]|uniref:Type IV pilus biogenesis/stability protein PilW n=1 Tax=Catenovulum adriaticum TaxID=2984846 RepID=A0ABY7AL02_9ALTE|nr:type IV pilus biogenesis/stability protein PilW [Catenovulum sp. TS8]WAJ69019.1 type IV pilus biogenesis/stability protein PilW [Catenovulum sp. TS8]